MRKKRGAVVDRERPLLDLRPRDEAARAKAARSPCPCRAGREAFEQPTTAASRLTRDIPPAVRAHALRVYEGAVRIRSLADSARRLEAAEEALGRKRASRPGGGGAGFRVRRSGTVERRGGGPVLRRPAA